MSAPEIALLIATFERPNLLRRTLESVALQAGVAGKMEVVVTDDGSTDDTAELIADFARSAVFPVRFTTHPHTTFRLCRSRNEGARASRAPYLLFLDGDCVLPRDHVRIHLERRKRGFVMAGDCCRLDQAASDRVTSDTIRSGAMRQWASESELERLRRLDRTSRFYRLIRHPTKPKLIGNNVGIWRADYERVNGYDENFQGWGCEDDDLRCRLRRAGVHVESILRWTHTYHLWHPVDVTAPAYWKQGANVNYLLRKGRLTRCRNGLEKRDLTDLAVQVVGQTSRPQAADRLLQGRFGGRSIIKPEVEILFLPGRGRFSGQAECNVLVALEPVAAKSRRVRDAHLLIAPAGQTTVGAATVFPLDQFESALRYVA